MSEKQYGTAGETPPHKRYRCPVCGWTPSATEPVGGWAHCPSCLAGIHEEDEDGFPCGGALLPISVWVKPNDSWEIIQRCRVCGALSSSPVSEDDSPVKLLSLASEPLAAPPFPIEKMAEMTDMVGGRGDVGGYYDEP